MSRTLPNNIIERTILGDRAWLIQFIELAFGSGPVRLTTAPFDVTWNGYTWLGVGGWMDFDAFTESSDPKSGALALTLSGVEQSLVSLLFDEQYLGRPVNIWYGWVSATNLFSNSGAKTNAAKLSSLGGATVSRDTAKFFDTTASIKVIVANASNSGVQLEGSSGPGGNAFPVLPGQPYTLQGRIHLPQGTVASTAGLRFSIWWLDSGGGFIAATEYFHTVSMGSEWQLFSVSGVAPAGATLAQGFVATTSVQGVWTFWLDAVNFAPGARCPLNGVNPVTGGDLPYQPTDGAAIQGGTVLNDPLLPFSGFMNGGFEVEESGGDTGKSVSVTGRMQSRLVAMFTPRGIRTCLERHNAYFRADRFFEFVPTIANKNLSWGTVQLGSIGQILQAGGFGNGGFPGSFHPPAGLGGSIGAMWR
jgi:hypothetical protein